MLGNRPEHSLGPRTGVQGMLCLVVVVATRFSDRSLVAVDNFSTRQQLPPTTKSAIHSNHPTHLFPPCCSPDRPLKLPHSLASYAAPSRFRLLYLIEIFFNLSIDTQKMQRALSSRARATALSSAARYRAGASLGQQLRFAHKVGRFSCDSYGTWFRRISSS